MLAVVRSLSHQALAANAQLRILNRLLPRLLASSEVGLLLPAQGVEDHGQRGSGGVSSFGYSGTIAHAALFRHGAHVDEHILLHPLAHPLVYRRRTFLWQIPPIQLCSSEVEAVMNSVANLGLDLVLSMVMHTLGGLVDADAQLMEAGVDSLGVVELRSQLQAAVRSDVSLPSTLVFDYPTARQLKMLLSTQMPPMLLDASRSPFDINKAPVETPYGTVVRLPGVDGSIFHFKALDDFLKALSFSFFDLPSVSQQETLDSWISSVAISIEAEHWPGSLVLLGYSAGAIMALVLQKHLASMGCPPAALVLIDPPSLSGMAGQTNLIDRSIATSVLDDVPLDLDVSLFRSLATRIFPSYVRTFEGGAAMARMIAGIDDTLFAREPVEEPSTAVLYLLSSSDHPVFEGLTGRASAAFYSPLLPQAQQATIASNHINIIYSQPTAHAILAFFSEVFSHEWGPRLVEKALADFDETRLSMLAAQKHFRDRFQAEYGGVDLRVGGITATCATDRAAYTRIQGLSLARPADIWAPIASRNLHWHSTMHAAWLCQAADGVAWIGWSAVDAAATKLSANEWQAWDALLDDTSAPFVRWFVGGNVNAAFNEIDRHVLLGVGDETAFIAEPSGDQTSRRQLLIRSTLAAYALQTMLGIKHGQRVAIHLPNEINALVWIEAAKRLGAPYTAIAAGTSSAPLAHRLLDTGAVVLVTSETTADAIKAESDIVVVVQADGDHGLPSGWYDAIALLTASHAIAVAAGVPLEELGSEFQHGQLIQALWTLATPEPVDASYPLFILYTSGSTGTPKGIVHAHGGYLTGLVATSTLVFDLQHSRNDVLFVVATPGWITGQSYMIAAAQLCRVPSVLLEGSPVSPPGRFASVMAHHQITVLKAGSTFLRLLMTRQDADRLLRQHDFSNLRLGTFCAEPVNDAVHRFAAEHLTPNYINSYWATEHGGIVWSRCHGNVDQPLRPDARSWPLPWIDGDVLIPTPSADIWRKAAPGEQGEVVIRRSYPYLALTVWSSMTFGKPEWRGDLKRWKECFAPGAGYLQGDAAVKYADGAYTFHGRTDEVMNVGGNRIGTEEIESAILLDREYEGSPLITCAVVGMADAVLGTVPCAFLVLRQGATLSAVDEGRIRATAQARLSSMAVPTCFLVVPALPETYSGKYMRRLLRAMIEGEPLGDLGALRNPECVEPLLTATAWSAPHGTASDSASGPTTSSYTPTLEQLTAGVLDVVHRLTGKANIAALEPLMDVGLNSLGATHLASQLEQQTGVQLSPTLVFEYSTANAVAAHLFASLRGDLSTVTKTKQVSAQRIGTPVSVTGLGLVWPAGTVTVETALHIASSGTNAICNVPVQRWVSTESVGHGAPQRSTSAGFTTGADLFNATFFMISPAESVAMDPQQRLLLENGHVALHKSNIELVGHNALIGVYAGIEVQDFSDIAFNGPLSVYVATGSSLSIASGRLSFSLGLHGPCAAYVTACSSSLVAYHAACQAVQLEECYGGVAAGVNMILLPGMSAVLGLAGMTSVLGRCHTFDRLADGYARGEACVASILEIGAGGRFTTCGTAVRSDGRSASLTAPNGQAQQSLLRAALAKAATSAESLAVAEAHGTGTALGDPIEAGSLEGVVLRARSSSCSPMGVSGVKANIGHAEPAAGLTGLVRLAVGLEQGGASPNAQLRALNSHVRSVMRSFRGIMPTQLAVAGAGDEPSDGMGRTIGCLSSFGYSGTIVHAVVRSCEAATATGVLTPRNRRTNVSFHRHSFPWSDSSHPLLQQRLAQSADDLAMFRSPTAGRLHALIAEHVVHGRVVFPGVAYLEVARAAWSVAANSSAAGAGLRGVFFLQPLALVTGVDGAAVLVECVLRKDGLFEVRSGEGIALQLQDASVHCTGMVLPPPALSQQLVGVAARRSDCAFPYSVGLHNDFFHTRGIQLGPAFRTLRRAWAGARRSNDAWRGAVAQLQRRKESHGALVHPADLDGAMQLSASLWQPSGGEVASDTRLPFAMDSVLLLGGVVEAWSVRAHSAHAFTTSSS